MAELTTQERLQPSLLDRLTDHEPDRQQESRDQRVLSLQRIREGVLRDLTWLLNAVHLEADVDLSPYPEVKTSVLNYGIPDLSGLTVTRANAAIMHKAVRQAIATFEPRIFSQNLKIRVTTNPEVMSRKALLFLIEGQMWAQPIPQNLHLRTDVDLETGRLKVTERAA